MCYCVITKENTGIPTVISQDNNSFPEYIMSGYEIVSTGTKRDMNDLAETMLNEICID